MTLIVSNTSNVAQSVIIHETLFRREGARVTTASHPHSLMGAVATFAVTAEARATVTVTYTAEYVYHK